MTAVTYQNKYVLKYVKRLQKMFQKTPITEIEAGIDKSPVPGTTKNHTRTTIFFMGLPVGQP